MTTSSEPDEATPPVVRGLQAVGFVFSIAEVTAWITVLVVAFDRGGAGAAGLAVVVQLVPTALLAPVVTAAGDRFPRHLVLTVGFAVLAASATGLAVSLASAADLWVVLLLGAVYTVALESTPATVASLLVRNARSPLQLLRWNIAQSFARTSGSLIGPLLTSALLVIAEPSWVFAALAMMCAFTAFGIATRLEADDRATAAVGLRTVLRASSDGIAYAASTPGPRRVIAFIAVSGLLIGAFDVFFVAVAFDELGRGGSAAAVLSAGFAAGGLAASALMHRRSSWGLLAITVAGGLLLSLPLVALGQVAHLATALVLVGALGAGNALVEIGGHTMLQRASSDSMTSRVFGILRSWFFLASSAGAAVAGFLVTRHDLSSSLAWIGVTFAVLLTLGSMALRRVATRSVAVDAAALVPLRTVEFLDRLPLPTLEELADRLDVRHVETGFTVITEGDDGAEFFVLVEGAVEITANNVVVDTVAAPCSFGEVALLHDCVRTATVTTTQPSRLLVIERSDFLEAIGRTTTSRNMALDVAERFRTPTGPPG
jgi:MFS family permease